MKINPGSENRRILLHLTRKQLRAMEQELGIYLDKPADVARTPNQQFGVYDENELHAGDIISDERYFSEEELRESILALFPDQG